MRDSFIVEKPRLDERGGFRGCSAPLPGVPVAFPAATSTSARQPLQFRAFCAEFYERPASLRGEATRAADTMAGTVAIPAAECLAVLLPMTCAMRRARIMKRLHSLSLHFHLPKSFVRSFHEISCSKAAIGRGDMRRRLASIPASRKMRNALVETDPEPAVETEAAAGRGEDRRSRRRRSSTGRQRTSRLVRRECRDTS